MDRPTLYIAGPMRGYNHFNFPAFFEAERLLQEQGWKSYNPARNDVENGFDPMDPEKSNYDDFSLADALAWDLARVLESDGVALLDGWENSTGVKAEIATAEAIGIPCIPIESILNEEFRKWLSVPHVTLTKKFYDYKMAETINLYSYRSEVVEKPDVPEQSKDESKVPLRTGYFLTGEESETRFRDSETGAEKGVKLSQMGALDPAALYTVSEVAGMGATKYARYNFLKGYPWMLSYDAMQRHAMKFASGEDIDPESGLPHLAHMTWHGLAMLSFYIHGLGTDDRWRKEKNDSLPA